MSISHTCTVFILLKLFSEVAELYLNKGNTYRNQSEVETSVFVKQTCPVNREVRMRPHADGTRLEQRTSETNVNRISVYSSCLRDGFFKRYFPFRRDTSGSMYIFYVSVTGIDMGYIKGGPDILHSPSTYDSDGERGSIMAGFYGNPKKCLRVRFSILRA